MPKAKFNRKDLHRTIFDKTAAYLFHLIQNHPFIDGNKRTATMSYNHFFLSNFKRTFTIINSENDYEDLILGVVQRVVSKKEIARFFRQHSENKKQ